MFKPKESTNLSRRDFLKLSAVAGFSLFMPENISNLGIKPSSEEQSFLATHEVGTGDTQRKIVLMTYDDFPVEKNIYTILNAYKNYRSKASFFLPAGSDRKNINLPSFSREVERIVTEGHVIGCHGFLHEPLTAYDSNTLRKDIEEWLKIIHEIIPGYKVNYMRFPYGDRNQRVREIFAEYGMQSVMWSLQSGGLDDKTYQRVTEGVKPGSIVLSHIPRYFDAKEADRILENLTTQGFGFESLDTGLKPSDYFKTQSPHSQQVKIAR